MMTKQKFAALVLGVFLASCASGQQQKAPPDLLKTEWLLEDLAGKGVLDRVQATLAFPGPDKVAGQGSCNRFFGGVKISGESIKFGALASTRMACASEAVSNQEASYLKALEGAEKIVMDGPYLLIHSKGLEKPLRFTQINQTGKP
ncbi:MAG: META domain-containing protein [Proteobacteria bacterium]|nr:META domain-containing protein [Pseudomonadota bacterium]